MVLLPEGPTKCPRMAGGLATSPVAVQAWNAASVYQQAIAHTGRQIDGRLSFRIS